MQKLHFLQVQVSLATPRAGKILSLDAEGMFELKNATNTGPY